MGPDIIVSLTLSTLIYQEGGKDTCLNFGALRTTAASHKTKLTCSMRASVLYGEQKMLLHWYFSLGWESIYTKCSSILNYGQLLGTNRFSNFILNLLKHLWILSDCYFQCLFTFILFISLYFNFFFFFF